MTGIYQSLLSASLGLAGSEHAEAPPEWQASVICELRSPRQYYVRLLLVFLYVRCRSLCRALRWHLSRAWPSLYYEIDCRIRKLYNEFYELRAPDAGKCPLADRDLAALTELFSRLDKIHTITHERKVRTEFRAYKYPLAHKDLAALTELLSQLDNIPTITREREVRAEFKPNGTVISRFLSPRLHSNFTSTGLGTKSREAPVAASIAMPTNPPTITLPASAAAPLPATLCVTFTAVGLQPRFVMFTTNSDRLFIFMAHGVDPQLYPLLV